MVVKRPKIIDRVRAAAEELDVDLETGGEHQQQLAQIRKEVGDRSILTEQAEHMRPEDDAGEQQPNHRGEPDAAGKWRNADDDRHDDGELCQRRQRQDLSLQFIEQFHLALLT